MVGDGKSTTLLCYLIFLALPSDDSQRIWFIFALMVIQGILASTLAFGQGEEAFNQEKARFDRTYGSDYNLLNGRQYFLLYSNTSDPFLNGELAWPGRLVLNGVEYEGVPINYDLYQQAVILQFQSFTGEIRYLVLNREAVDEFALYGKLFRKVALPGEDEKYVQVIEYGDARFVISWKKNMNYTASMGTAHYNYTKASRRIYLEVGGGIHPAGTKSAFLEALDESRRTPVKQFMRKERIRIGRASDRQLLQLLEFCDQTEEGGP